MQKVRGARAVRDALRGVGEGTGVLQESRSTVGRRRRGSDVGFAVIPVWMEKTVVAGGTRWEEKLRGGGDTYRVRGEKCRRVKGVVADLNGGDPAKPLMNPGLGN